VLTLLQAERQRECACPGAANRHGASGNLPSTPLSTGLPVTDVLVVQTAKPPLKVSGPDRR